MLDFKIFNIPVRVEPWFWLTGFLLGGGLYINSRESLLSTVIWMLVLLFSILIHELGHALTSRKLTRVNPSIRLWAMGGLAYPNTHPTRKQSFWITWSGPLAGLAFFLVISLICCVIYGPSTGARIIAWMAFPKEQILDFQTARILFGMNDAVFDILRGLVLFNLWWSLVNLLPVYPLDGGQIYASLEDSQLKVFKVGMVTAILAAIVGLVVFQRLFVVLLFGFLAYQNYQRIQEITGRSGFR